MQTPQTFEEYITRTENFEFLQFLMNFQYIVSEIMCETCNNACSFVEYKRSPDKYAWWFLTTTCSEYKNYYSLRKNSFFEDLRSPIQTILKIIIK
jgi:hypothetical protein